MQPEFRFLRQDVQKLVFWPVSKQWFPEHIRTNISWLKSIKMYWSPMEECLELSQCHNNSLISFIITIYSVLTSKGHVRYMYQDNNTDFKNGDFVKIYGTSLNFKLKKLLQKSLFILCEDASHNISCWLTGVKSHKYDKLLNYLGKKVHFGHLTVKVKPFSYSLF